MPKRILIIEDDKFISDLYDFAFSKSDYIVDHAMDGEIAIQKATIETYDVILLDIMLPKVTGIDVLRRIRTTENPSKKTPVILSTNLAEDKIINEAMSLGANGYILKAELEPTDVVKKVNDILQNLKPFSF
ncbi:hypothetical protein BH11PAT1_BH11PAT1_2120 [soil metagenome]